MRLLNLPLPRGTGDGDYLRTLDTGLDRIASFGADVIVEQNSAPDKHTN